MTKYIRNFVNGMAFGVTQIVPGVSGGTIAIILGFYDELIEAVNHFTGDARKYLKLLIPLLLGIAAGIILFGSLVHYLLTSYSFPTMLFFIGLIVGIIPLIYAKVKEPGQKLKSKEVALVLVPMILLIAVSGLKPQTVTAPADVIAGMGAGYMVFLFFVGVIAAAALVIPGVSGSFVMLLLGVYHVVVYSVSSIRYWLGDITNLALFLEICKVLAPFAIGVVIGGLFTARLVEKFLKEYEKAIYSVILGLLSGSVFVLFREPIVFQSGVTAVTAVIGVITFLAGCAAAFAIGKKRL
jgi:putative membrane protein